MIYKELCYIYFIGDSSVSRMGNLSVRVNFLTKKGSFRRGRITATIGGISILVVRVLAKDEGRVRFSYPAQFFYVFYKRFCFVL